MPYFISCANKATKSNGRELELLAECIESLY